MATTQLHPPEELADADLVALILPFDEEVSSDHPDAPVRYRWGDVPLPRRELPLRERHDGKEIGILSSFVLARSGIWARLKAGRTASALIAKGYTGISAEIDDGELVGAALVTNGRPAFASARVFGPAVLDAPDEPLRLGMESATGAISFFRPAAVQRATRVIGSGNLSAASRFNQGMSMGPVHDEVHRARQRFQKRREEIAEADALDEQMRLVAEGRPVALWPAHLPMRQQYDRLVQQQQQQAANAVKLAGAVAATEFAERMQRLAERSRRRWWRWHR